MPTLETTGTWDEALEEPSKEARERALPARLVRQQWFGAKGRRIAATTIADTIRIQDADPDELRGLFALVDVTFTEGEPATYAFPLVGRRDGDDIGPETVVAGSNAGRTVAPRRQAPGRRAGRRAARDDRAAPGRARASTPPHRHARRGVREAPRRGPDGSAVPVGRSDEHLGDVRRPARPEAVPPARGGINPELEIGRFLTDRTSFIHAAPMAGAIELTDGGAASTVAFLQGFVQNEGDAWQYALDAVRKSFERARRAGRPGAAPRAERLVMDMVGELPSLLTYDLIGPFLGSAWLLGRRTAQLHLALGSRPDDPVFAPGPRHPDVPAFALPVDALAGRVDVAAPRPPRAGPEVEELLARQDELLSRFAVVTGERISASGSGCTGTSTWGRCSGPAATSS